LWRANQLDGQTVFDGHALLRRRSDGRQRTNEQHGQKRGRVLLHKSLRVVDWMNSVKRVERLVTARARIIAAESGKIQEAGPWRNFLWGDTLRRVEPIQPISVKKKPMAKKSRLLCVVFIIMALPVFSRSVISSQADFDLLIAGGRVVDGTG